jgi:hypothetical protein
MDIKKIVVEQLAQDILSGWVNPGVRDQEVVVAAARKWAEDAYDYIESMKAAGN